MSKLDLVRNKIFEYNEVDRLLDFLRPKYHRIVFTNGCFDILHLGHIDYLSKAADLGDCLVVGLNTDASVARIKGKHRPLIDELSRSLTLASIQFVDAVIKFDEDTPYKLISSIVPDVLVKGKDYSVEEVVGHKIVLAAGGKVVTIDLVPGYSTTMIEKKIRAS